MKRLLCVLGLAAVLGGCGKSELDVLTELTEWAEQGDAQSQFELGEMYSLGYGVAKDDEEAVKWYRKAAEQGYRAAKKALSDAAEQGQVVAQYNLGLMYANGEGVAKDEAESFKWYRKAAEQGHAEAQCNLGVAYARGDVVAKDQAEAVKWLRKAAERGHAKAQEAWGSSLEDEAESVKWWRMAAHQGSMGAQYKLGVAYMGGKGVAKDFEEGIKWLRKAADQGHAEAIDLLKLLGVE